MQRGSMAGVSQLTPGLTKGKQDSTLQAWVRWLAFWLVELDRYP